MQNEKEQHFIRHIYLLYAVIYIFKFYHITRTDSVYKKLITIFNNYNTIIFGDISLFSTKISL